MAKKLGRPQIVINFKSKASTAINRSGRGVGVMILNDENVLDKVVLQILTLIITASLILLLAIFVLSILIILKL